MCIRDREYIGYIGVYWGILGYIWVYWGILGYIWVYWCILGYIGYIGVYWGILGYIGIKAPKSESAKSNNRNRNSDYPIWGSNRRILFGKKVYPLNDLK